MRRRADPIRRRPDPIRRNTNPMRRRANPIRRRPDPIRRNTNPMRRRANPIQRKLDPTQRKPDPTQRRRVCVPQERLPRVISQTHGRRKGAARFQPPTSARAAQTFPTWRAGEISASRFSGRQQDAAAPLRALSFWKFLLAMAHSIAVSHFRSEIVERRAVAHVVPDVICAE
jgi:hypothetical protein